MIRIVRRATRVAALLTYMTMNMVFVLSTTYVVRPDPGATSTSTLMVLLFLVLVLGLTSLDVRVTHDLGFREPGWVLVPRFALMTAAVLASDQIHPTPTLRAVALTVVALAVARGVFQVAVMLNRRVVEVDSPEVTQDDDLEVIELPPVLVSCLLALDPFVDAYCAGLAFLFGDPEEVTTP